MFGKYLLSIKHTDFTRWRRESMIKFTVYIPSFARPPIQYPIFTKTSLVVRTRSRKYLKGVHDEGLVNIFEVLNTRLN